jgi:hypothetical protein
MLQYGGRDERLISKRLTLTRKSLEILAFSGCNNSGNGVCSLFMLKIPFPRNSYVAAGINDTNLWSHWMNVKNSTSQPGLQKPKGAVFSVFAI